MSYLQHIVIDTESGRNILSIEQDSGQCPQIAQKSQMGVPRKVRNWGKRPFGHAAKRTWRNKESEDVGVDT